MTCLSMWILSPGPFRAIAAFLASSYDRRALALLWIVPYGLEADLSVVWGWMSNSAYAAAPQALLGALYTRDLQQNVNIRVHCNVQFVCIYSYWACQRAV